MGQCLHLFPLTDKLIKLIKAIHTSNVLINNVCVNKNENGEMETVHLHNFL